MFITENQSLFDSILFLTSARQALKFAVEESSVPKKKELAFFIMNEASDYEVMHLLVRGELPNEKYNHVDELTLFSELKQQVVDNLDVVTEAFGFGVVKDFITTVDSVYPKYSTAAPILEHLVKKEQVMNEGIGEDLIKGVKVMTQGFKTAGQEGGAALKDVATGPSAVAVKKMLKTSYEANKKLWEAGKEELAARRMADKYNIPKDMAKKIVGLQKKYAGKSPAEVIKSLAGPAGEKAKEVGQAVAKGTEELGKGIIKGTEKAKELAGKAAGIDKEQAMSMLKTKATGAGDAVMRAVSNPKVVGAIAASALGALALYAANKTYKRYMTKAGKACAGKKGAEQKACVKNFKAQALKAQIADLQKAAGACSKAKKPDKCKAPILKKIGKLKAKVDALS